MDKFLLVLFLSFSIYAEKFNQGENCHPDTVKAVISDSVVNNISNLSNKVIDDYQTDINALCFHFTSIASFYQMDEAFDLFESKTGVNKHEFMKDLLYKVRCPRYGNKDIVSLAMAYNPMMFKYIFRNASTDKKRLKEHILEPRKYGSDKEMNLVEFSRSKIQEFKKKGDNYYFHFSGAFRMILRFVSEKN